jgi:MFS family permease
VARLRSLGAKRVTLKTGAYPMRELAMAIRWASDAKLDLLTIDGAPGGTGMSPWRMMSEWGVPAIYLHSMAYELCDRLAKKGAWVPDIAFAGGFSSEDHIFKALALGAPYTKAVCMGRALMIPGMVGKNIGRWLQGEDGGLPATVSKYGSSVEEIFVSYEELKKRFGAKEVKEIPLGALGIFTAGEKLKVGLQQLMAGARKWRVNLIERRDLACLTEQAAKITGLPYIMDAYRREDLSDRELGLGSSLYVNGYRLGMLLASGGGLMMADHISFRAVYIIMAACLGVGIVATLLCREPPVAQGRPASLREAVWGPFKEFFTRSGLGWGLWVLAFILLYKIGDSMASAMTIPFYLDLGFTKTQIGAVVKLFGFWAAIAGSLAGGVLMLKWGINRSLWGFGFLQAVSTAGFAVLAQIGPSTPWLAGVIAFENFSGGMGTAAYVAFMASLTNKRFTATQYALLSSLMGAPRVLASAPTGFMAQWLGWQGFFIFCTLAAAPGMLLLFKFAPWRGDAIMENARNAQG